MKYIKHFSNLSGQTEYLNSTELDTYLGYVDENDTVYYDDALPERYDNKYFTIESLEDGNTIYLKASDSTAAKTVSASTDNGETWVEYTSSVDDNGTALGTLNTGDKLLIKGENAAYAPSQTVWNQFKSTGQFEVYGNIMSLVSGDSFVNADALTEDYALYALFYGCPNITSAENLVLPATTLSESCYEAMFQNCTSLTTAPELPATTLAYGCYQGMLGGCTSLTTAPQLPALNLANWCYASMFKNCTSLTAAPALPATTLSEHCYQYMFQNCSNLTAAPELPATTLASRCYGNMFNGCTNLNSITCLAIDISASNCTYGWVNGVASTGTFVKNAAMTSWTTGTSGIPNGWTVVDA